MLSLPGKRLLPDTTRTKARKARRISLAVRRTFRLEPSILWRVVLNVE